MLDALDKQRDADLHKACSPSAGGSAGSAACLGEYAQLQGVRATYGHFYLGPELTSSSNFAHMSAQDWLQVHEDVSKVVQFLNWYDPQRVPAAGASAHTRDPLTNMPLDAQGRYSRTVVIGGEMYQPKFHSCAATACAVANANLDMSDPATQAYVKALDQQVFKDIGTGATVGSLVTPVGVPGAVLAITGAGANVGETVLSSDPLATGFDKGIEEGAESAGKALIEKLLGHTPATAARAAALINLGGGWEAFRERVKVDLLGMKPDENK